MYNSWEWSETGQKAGFGHNIIPQELQAEEKHRPSQCLTANKEYGQSFPQPEPIGPPH